MCIDIMKQFWILAATCVVLGKISEGEAVDLTIPKNLTIGVASSSFQIEGAWNVSGKGVGIWDDFTQNKPESIADGSNMEIADNSYYKYKEDVAYIKSIGFDVYRFSISWERIFPYGFTNVTSQEGLQYYVNLTEELVANGIMPHVTLHHLDHPQYLEDLGGWTNEEMIDWFVDYARFMFEALGDHVKVWVTINEPNVLCLMGYGTSTLSFAPGKALNSSETYQCMHNILKSHAKIYHMYDEEFRPTQDGEIGIAGHCFDFQPADLNDTTPADTMYELMCGWMFHPFYNGDYPEVMKTKVAELSAAQGYTTSFLPEFSDEWISYIKGTCDYFGVNFYSSMLVSSTTDESAISLVGTGFGLVTGNDPDWPTTAFALNYVTPLGLKTFLIKIRDAYNNPPVRIMENGCADKSGTTEDYARIEFFYVYIEQLLTAIKEYACNVKSYTVWSLLDSFELNSGYTIKFGLVNVDFDDANRTRSEKLSASWWRSVLESRELQPVPSNSTSTVDTTSD